MKNSKTDQPVELTKEELINIVRETKWTLDEKLAVIEGKPQHIKNLNNNSNNNLNYNLNKIQPLTSH